MTRVRKRIAGIGDAQFDRLRLRVLEVADRLSSDQVLELADVLHQLLRQRSGAQFRLGSRTSQSSSQHTT